MKNGVTLEVGAVFSLINMFSFFSLCSVGQPQPVLPSNKGYNCINVSDYVLESKNRWTTHEESYMHLITLLQITLSIYGHVRV